MRIIDELYLENPSSGSRTISRQLRRQGKKVNRKRVQRLIRRMGIEAVYPKSKTSRPHPQHKIYPYLLRNLTIDRSNQVWAADITYIPMDLGFMYLVVIIGWHSRKFLFWRVSNTMDTDGRNVVDVKSCFYHCHAAGNADINPVVRRVDHSDCRINDGVKNTRVCLHTSSGKCCGCRCSFNIDRNTFMHLFCLQAYVPYHRYHDGDNCRYRALSWNGHRIFIRNQFAALSGGISGGNSHESGNGGGNFRCVYFSITMRDHLVQQFRRYVYMLEYAAIVIILILGILLLLVDIA